MRDARSVILKPLITEKGSRLREEGNKYIFSVLPDANKIEIKRAVQDIFDVKVRDVKTIVVRGKIKRMGAFEGKRPDWKKAVVTLEKGHSIDLFEQV